MKILLLSDLHLEKRTDTLVYNGGADLVVLAGDIHTKGRGVSWAHATFDCPVLYVPGNHEGWGEHWQKTIQKMKDESKGTNVSVLHNDQKTIDGVRFLGTPLWTDFGLLGSDQKRLAMDQAGEGRDMYKAGMRDYKYIRTGGYRRILPRDTLEWNTRAREWLINAATKPHSGPTVVITHHPPVPPPRFDKTKATLFDCAYINDWQNGVEQIHAQAWFYGHTHDPKHFLVGETLMATHAVGHQEERLNALYKSLIEVTDERTDVLEPDDNILVARDNVKNKKTTKMQS